MRVVCSDSLRARAARAFKRATRASTTRLFEIKRKTGTLISENVLNICKCIRARNTTCSLEMDNRQWWLTAVILVLILAIIRTQETVPSPYYYEVLEEQSTGYYLANIRQDAQLADKYDADTLDSLRYQFLIQPSIRVGLDPITSVISTTDVIDRDSICPNLPNCNITLEIAIQPIQYFQIIKAIVNIMDINDIAPEFPQPSITKSIAESADIGDTILLPTAQDDDSPEYGVTLYELHGPDSWAFSLESLQRLDGVNEVKLVLETTLDRENKERYSLKVWAYDGGEPPNSGYIDVTITVQDSNDNSPVFENSTYFKSLSEDHQLGVPFLQVRAHDPDIGLNGALEYDLSFYSQEMYGRTFSVDRRTGDIRLERPLDFEQTQRYTLSVTARDKGTDPIESETTVIISVIDVNDESPIIKINTLSASDTDHAEVTENLDAQTFVAHVTVTDGDSDENGRVSCSLNDPNFELIRLYDAEFKVVTKFILDRENSSLHDVLIVCHDNGIPQLRSAKHITISVLDENDNSPYFYKNIFNASIHENNEIGSTLLEILAVDFDAGDNGRIEFTIPSSVSDQIQINSTTGIITALRSFDREYESRFIFNVMARDHGALIRSSSATVIINILDQNDERPLFTESMRSFGVTENSAVGTLIGSVQALDDDAFPFNQCEYALLPSNDSWMFSIEPESGRIINEGALDRELQASYYVTISATDIHNSALFSCLDVVIHITDVNDETPSFLFPSSENHTVYISPQVPEDYLVTKVLALDLDQGQNARMTFTIIDGNNGGYFYIHHSSGYLTVSKKFKNIKYKEYTLGLKVEDNGYPQLSSISSLKIIVDSAIAYSSHNTSPTILSQTKLIIIIVLSIASAILVIILLFAIFLLRRMESKRKLQQRKVTRMEGLSKLTINNNQGTLTRVNSAAGKTGSLGRGGKNGVASKRASICNGSTLWKTPSENQLDVSNNALSHWPTSYPASALKSLPCPEINLEHTGHDTDASADGSQVTNDSGRGPSDIGDYNQKCNNVVSKNNTDPKRVKTPTKHLKSNANNQRSRSPSLRTFTPPPSQLSKAKPDIISGEYGSRNDCSFQVAHARPLTIVPGPVAMIPVTGANKPSPKKGAVVNIADIQSRDPKRTRAYYKDTPLFNQNKDGSKNHTVGIHKYDGNRTLKGSTFV